MNNAIIKFANATKNELFDVEYNGGEWMVEAVETAETLEQCIESAAGWNARSAMKRGEIAGLPYIAWAQVQVRKGEARRAMSVIDLGDIRYAIDADLARYA